MEANLPDPRELSDEEDKEGDMLKSLNESELQKEILMFNQEQATLGQSALM